MSLGHATIDWYADGFEVRLEGGPPLGEVPALMGFFGALATVALLLSSFAWSPELPWQLKTGILVGTGAASVVSMAVAAVNRERRPVHVLAVDAHRLKVTSGQGTEVLDVLLEEITGVDVVLGHLEIGHPSGVVKVDASAQVHESLEVVQNAIRAAVAARRQPETPQDRRRREQALAQLQQLRQGQ